MCRRVFLSPRSGPNPVPPRHPKNKKPKPHKSKRPKSAHRQTGKLFENLVALQARLRAPGGCPWDREQTHHTLKAYLIEESYEVLDALEHGDPKELTEELGDLLLQILFHADIGREAGRFDIADVISGIHEKLVRRHPHVFGKVKADNPEQVGFDWETVEGIFTKLLEETSELRVALSQPDGSRREEEVGDLLFVVVNLARFLGFDPEVALKHSNLKFKLRFQNMEADAARSGQRLAQLSKDELEVLWEAAKKRERSAAHQETE